MSASFAVEAEWSRDSDEPALRVAGSVVPEQRGRWDRYGGTEAIPEHALCEAAFDPDGRELPLDTFTRDERRSIDAALTRAL